MTDSFQKLLSELYAINNTSGIKLGLENMVRLDTLLGNPSKKFRSVHVAGTNGKGSVTAKTAKGLESRFTRVGLYTSPHISTIRERIVINGKYITEQEFEETLSSIMLLAKQNGIPATFFELTTALAFTHFAKLNVDIAVIETGLGGRLDATNIILPDLSVITSIDFDHTQFLGNSLEDIAKEKAGIIKPNVPVILGPTASLVPVPLDSKIIQVKGPFNTVEEENRGIARAALESYHVPEKTIQKALTTRLPCRREWMLYHGKDVILDVAHNPSGLKGLFKELNLPKNELRVVCGLSKEKDLKNCLNIIQENANHIHLVDAKNDQCASVSELYQILVNLGVSQERLHMHESTREGLSSACQLTKEKVLVCGTFFIMDEAKRLISR